MWWLAFSPDQRRLFAASHNGRITIFQAESGEPLGAITGLDRPTDGLAVSPDGLLLAILQKRKLSVWKSDGSAELWQAPANLNRCAVFSPDGEWIATGGQDRIITLWNVSSPTRSRKLLRGHSSPVTGVAFSPDGRRLASSGMDTVKLWDSRSAAELISLPLEQAGAWHVAFSPDGKTIAAAGGDGAVTLWKIE